MEKSSSTVSPWESINSRVGKLPTGFCRSRIPKLKISDKNKRMKVVVVIPTTFTKTSTFFIFCSHFFLYSFLMLPLVQQKQQIRLYSFFILWPWMTSRVSVVYSKVNKLIQFPSVYTSCFCIHGQYCGMNWYPLLLHPFLGAVSEHYHWTNFNDSFVLYFISLLMMVLINCFKSNDTLSTTVYISNSTSVT